MRKPLSVAALALLMAVLVLPLDPAAAYAGPGLGLGALATAFGIVAAMVLGLVSIVFYPLRRMVRRLRGAGRPARGARE